MNTKTLIVITGAVVFIVAIGGFLFLEKEEESPLLLDPQISSEGSVEIEVTPITISDTSDTWQFKMILNTHSVELDQDLTTASILIDDEGNEHRPLRWEGAPPGGHHREGILSFNRISPKPNVVTLVIKDIGGITERAFTWEL